MDNQRSFLSVQNQDKRSRERLTTEELEMVLSKVFTSRRLTVAREVLVFCCLPGLPFIDVKNLTRNMIATGIGEKRIFTNR
jgi:hypothetical protein